MHIWKSPSIFVFILRRYSEGFALIIILRIIELLTREVCINFLKSRLIVNILLFLKYFLNKSHISGAQKK